MKAFLALLFAFFAVPVAGAVPECGPGIKPGDTCKAAVKKLRPTQFAIGWFDVEEKIDNFDVSKKQQKQYVKNNPVKAVIGPDGEIYVIDRHHLARAALSEEVENLRVMIMADYSKLTEEKFWERMQRKKWVRLIDHKGVERTIAELPRTMAGLRDDPYRSLAYVVRELGGIRKEYKKPFAEFEWADYFRTRIQLEPPPDDLKEVVEEAMKLARHPDAKKLPGYRMRRVTPEDEPFSNSLKCKNFYKRFAS